MKKRFFISNALEEEKLPFIPEVQLKFGRAHYSWKIVANLYQRGLDASGIETQRVIRPEIYQSNIAQKTFGVRFDDTHLVVKPIEHIRPFYGMTNIFVCGWEFPEFSKSALNGNPLNNHINILKKANQVWCWSDFTTNNLRLNGVDSAITLPPPAILFDTVDYDHTIEAIPALTLNTEREPVPSDIFSLSYFFDKYNDSVVFFSVLNPFDKRKQIKSMLDAFVSALNHNNNMVLLIKLVIDNELTTLANIQELLSIHHDFRGVCDWIIFVSENMKDQQMLSLMMRAKFYLCTSSTEGLNLPMIEAMSLGVVPLSTTATAMNDYINQNNSIIIDYDAQLTKGAYHYLHNVLSTTHYPPKMSSIIDAIVFASKISSDKYERLSSQAKKEVYQKYSIQSFTEKLSAIGMIK